MDQLATQKTTIQIQGVIENNRRKEEITSILRMLQFSYEELYGFGFIESAEEIRHTMDNLQRQLDLH